MTRVDASASVPLTDSLITLDLSNNHVGADGLLSLSELLAQPNQLRSLKLAGCNIPAVELMFGALVRGCQQLQELSVDDNKFGQISDAGNASFDSFVKNAQSLTSLNVSRTKFPSSLLRQLMAGVADNFNLHEITLAIRGNDFGLADAQCIAKTVAATTSIAHLDIGDNNFDGDDGLAALLEACKSNAKLTGLSMD